MTQVKEKTVDSTKIAKAMVEMMRSLSDVMDYEVDLLTRRDYAGLNGLRTEKARLVRDYQISINKISENPTMLKDVGVDLHRQLRDEGERLDKVAQRNANELRSAIFATQSLVQTIMDNARSQLAENKAYKNLGDVRQRAAAYSPISEAVAIDQSA